MRHGRGHGLAGITGMLGIMCIILSGCALVMPTRIYDEATPIDTGLAGMYLSTAAVMPFEAVGYENWGVYAAKKLTGSLLKHKAFRQVVYAEKKPPEVNYIITGTLENLSYGGNEGPTTVSLTVKVVGASDSQTYFYRTAKESSKKSAFHMSWLRRVDVPSPYIEGVLSSMVDRIAKDISSRTNLPAVQNP
ncbi:MAG TPA: hypothetical protein VMU10_07035 [Desulfomonilia bacterium]|nr:hypothetical protein [Desulfomonilia bacterium]